MIFTNKPWHKLFLSKQKTLWKKKKKTLNQKFQRTATNVVINVYYDMGVKHILCHVLDHFQIHLNYITLEVDWKLNIFCRYFRDFVRLLQKFLPFPE